MGVKLVSIKKTAAEMKAEKKRNLDAPGFDSDRVYPYNTDLSLDTKVVSKIPALADVDADDIVMLVAKCKVTRVESTQRSINGDARKEHTVTLQIDSMNISKEDNFDSAFEKAAKESDSRRK